MLSSAVFALPYNITSVGITTRTVNGSNYAVLYRITTAVPTSCTILELKYSTDTGGPTNAFVDPASFVSYLPKQNIREVKDDASLTLIPLGDAAGLGLTTHLYKLTLGQGKYAIKPYCSPSCGDGVCTGSETSVNCNQDCCEEDSSGTITGNVLGYVSATSIQCKPACQTLTTPKSAAAGYVTQTCVNSPSIVPGVGKWSANTNGWPFGGPNVHRANTAQACPLEDTGKPACITCAEGLYIDPANPNAGCTKIILTDGFCRADFGESSSTTDCLGHICPIDVGSGTERGGVGGQCISSPIETDICYLDPLKPALATYDYCGYDGCWATDNCVLI